MKNLLYILSIFVLFSCGKDTEDVDFGYSYFGWEEGRYVVYDGMYINHDASLSPAHDTTFYKLKTVVGKEYIDNEGRSAKEFTRYLWNEDDQAWEVKDLYTCIIADGRAELVEENQRKIKLVFAVTEDKFWDMNAFNTQAEQTCYYENIGVARVLNGEEFDSTVTVIHAKSGPLIQYELKFEVYAKEVGMIRKYYKDVFIPGSDTNNIELGKEEILTLTDFGIE